MIGMVEVRVNGANATRNDHTKSCFPLKPFGVVRISEAVIPISNMTQSDANV